MREISLLATVWGFIYLKPHVADTHTSNIILTLSRVISITHFVFVLCGQIFLTREFAVVGRTLSALNDNSDFQATCYQAVPMVVSRKIYMYNTNTTLKLVTGSFAVVKNPDCLHVPL